NRCRRNCNIFFQAIVFIFGVSFFSCTQKKDRGNQNTFAPVVVEAKGYIVPKDSITEPKVVPVGAPIIVKAGAPIIVPANTNVFTSGEPIIVVAGQPNKIKFGKDTFLLPKLVPSIDSQFLAGIPEIVIAKDAHVNDDNPKNFSTFNKLQGLKNGYISCIMEDKNRNLWFGTRGGGVSKYDGKSFTHFTDKEGLSSNYIWSILEDKNGNIWFATDGEGVCKYDGKYFTHYKQKEGLSDNTVYCMLEDKSGNLWFGTDNGICEYNGNLILEKNGIDKKNKSSVNSNGKNVRSFTQFTSKQGLSNRSVLSMLEDKNGDLWLGTESGAYKYDGSSFLHFTQKEGFTNQIIRCMIEDKIGNICYATDGSGLYKYDGNRVDAIERGDYAAKLIQQDIRKMDGKLVKSFTHFTEKEGLFNNVVLTMLEDKIGNIWLGNYTGGVCKYDGNRVEAIERGDKTAQRTQEDINRIDGKLVKSFTHFTTKEGLSINDVRSMLEDKSGNLWFGTDGAGV
ncbi:MAG: hypothetical protein NTX97_13330, partial [Bacteroidetes bacterium]|nr:hypothetical protein [Bacteroidota bacterium]